MPPVSSNVRRCLFPTDPSEQPTTDNSTNIIRESIETERREKSKKWNFDFKNDRPLVGRVQWIQGDGINNDWIGICKDNDDEDDIGNMQSDGEAQTLEVPSKDADGMLPQTENETTPKSNKDTYLPLPTKKRTNKADGRDFLRVKRRILDQL